MASITIDATDAPSLDLSSMMTRTTPSSSSSASVSQKMDFEQVRAFFDRTSDFHLDPEEASKLRQMYELGEIERGETGKRVFMKRKGETAVPF